jgi:hypothetical protein
MLVLILSSVTLIYYGLMRASGKADQAEEKIIEIVSSAMPDNIKTVPEKARSGVYFLSRTVRQAITSIYGCMRSYPRALAERMV